MKIKVSESITGGGLAFLGGGSVVVNPGAVLDLTDEQGAMLLGAFTPDDAARQAAQDMKSVVSGLSKKGAKDTKDTDTQNQD